MATTPEQHHGNTKDTTHERLAQNIAGGVGYVQSRLSRRLNRTFAKLDRRVQLTVFMVAVIAMAAYCMCLIMANIR